MSYDPHTIQHAFASLRFAFHVLGFQQAYQEMLVLQHTTEVSFSPPPLPSHVPRTLGIQPVSSGVADSTTSSVESADDIEEATDTLKEVTISVATPAAPKKKYMRTVPDDAQRCTQQLSTGQRCTFTKMDKSDLCTRHHAVAMSASTAE